MKTRLPTSKMASTVAGVGTSCDLTSMWTAVAASGTWWRAWAGRGSDGGGGDVARGTVELRLRETAACWRLSGTDTETDERRRWTDDDDGWTGDKGDDDDDVVLCLVTAVASEGFIPSVVPLSFATDLRNASARNWSIYTSKQELISRLDHHHHKRTD